MSNLAGNRLHILRKLEEWIVFVHPSLKKFPKVERFTIGQKIQNISLDCVTYVQEANFDKSNRKNHILKARVAISNIQILIRVAKTLSLISNRHYELYSEKLTEIAKMLAGWNRVS